MNLIIREKCQNQTLLRLTWITKIVCFGGEMIRFGVGTLEFEFWLC